MNCRIGEDDRGERKFEREVAVVAMHRNQAENETEGASSGAVAYFSFLHVMKPFFVAVAVVLAFFRLHNRRPSTPPSCGLINESTQHRQ